MKSPDSDFQAGSFRMGCRDCTVQTCQTKGVILQQNTLVFLQGRRHKEGEHLQNEIIKYITKNEYQNCTYWGNWVSKLGVIIYDKSGNKVQI